MRRPTVLIAWVLLAAAPSPAGPLEARERWEAAKATTQAPWPLRVRALRAVVAEAHPTDSIHGRALMAIASTLRRAGHVHGALAYDARAAHLGGRRSRRRIDAALRLGKALRREMDLDAARGQLMAVADDGYAVARRSAEAALALLAADAFDRRDAPDLARLHARLVRQKARASVLLEALGWRGLLALEAGDRRRAERLYRAARRFYAKTATDEGRDAVRCAKLWLDFPLRRALASHPGG